MELSHIQFFIINSMADGSEPLSVICFDVFRDNKQVTVSIIAKEIEYSSRIGLIISEDEGILSQKALEDHYEYLVEELGHKKHPTYNEKGEIFIEMTEKGRKEWNNPKYEKFYDKQ